MAKTGKRYTEEQIIGMILKEEAAAKNVGDVIRRRGISAHTTGGRRSTLGWT